MKRNVIWENIGIISQKYSLRNIIRKTQVLYNFTSQIHCCRPCNYVGWIFDHSNIQDFWLHTRIKSLLIFISLKLLSSLANSNSITTIANFSNPARPFFSWLILPLSKNSLYQTMVYEKLKWKLPSLAMTCSSLLIVLIPHHVTKTKIIFLLSIHLI